MAELRWTPQAADDLEAITEFIAKDSPNYARLFATDVLAVLERLSGFPFSGRVVPEMNDAAIREVILGNYRIIYRATDELVTVLAIHHGARLLDPTVFEFLPDR
ncbi:MAG: type II toxin-antitoxin system RelE/ParE family toxin [Acidobacteriota bacterium]